MKIKTSPTSPKFRHQKESEIENLYRQEDLKKIEKAKKSSPGIFTIIFLSLVFGFLAGILSLILLFMYGSEIPILKEIFTTSPLSQSSVIIKQQKETMGADEIKINQATEKVLPAMVDIFVKKTESNKNLEQIYLSNERKGEGLILTNDGLIISTNQVIDDLEKDYVVMTSDKDIYPVESVIKDSITSMIFLKIKAENLPVAGWADLENLYHGEEALVLQNNINSSGYDVSLASIENLEYRDVSTTSDLIESSEKFSDLILLNENFTFNTFSSPVINLGGEVIGLILKKENLNFVYPLQYIKPILNSVLKSNSIERPYLGIYYLDLSEVNNVPKSLSQERDKGALIYNNEAKTPSIIAQSPAEKAGLKDKDIILKVSNDLIDQKNSLTDYIQNYKVGDIVSLTILRDGLEKGIKVELEKAPTAE